MAQKPLVDGRKGEAPLVHARLIPDDFDRVTRLAASRGITRSQFVRDAVRLALGVEDPAPEAGSAQAVA
jgi:hypothetical protein